MKYKKCPNLSKFKIMTYLFYLFKRPFLCISISSEIEELYLKTKAKRDYVP